MGTTVNVYGVCTPGTSTVSFNGNGATTAGTYTAVTATYNAAMPNISSYTKPAKTYNTFNGYWDTSAASGGTQYYTAALASARTWNKTSNTTLYARWVPYTYTVAYNGNGNTGGSTASSTHTVGVAKALTANGFTKTNYTFAGWATSASGSVVYSNSQSVTNLSTTNGATVTLYAKWNPVNYQLKVTSTCNGVSSHQCGTFDVTVAGTLKANDVTSYDVQHPYNSSYKIHDIKAANGATISSTTDITGTITGTTTKALAYTFQNKTFNYNGQMQSFKIPVTGIYRFWLYGAQGGTYAANNSTGGKGGKVGGEKTLSAGTTLYIGVGQQPSSYTGGYNGGGEGGRIIQNNTVASGGNGRGGGGATHIGTVNYLLASVPSGNRSASYIYAVAGGGGGSAASSEIIAVVGGVGGAGTGGTGTPTATSGTGGSQSAGGTSPAESGATGTIKTALADTKGDFGVGGKGCVAASTKGVSAGGGAGWYGGGGGGKNPSIHIYNNSVATCSVGGNGGGGSNYTGGITKITSGTNSGSVVNVAGDNGGNGSAIIGWVSAS